MVYDILKFSVIDETRYHYDAVVNAYKGDINRDIVKGLSSLSSVVREAKLNHLMRMENNKEDKSKLSKFVFVMHSSSDMIEKAQSRLGKSNCKWFAIANFKDTKFQEYHRIDPGKRLLVLLDIPHATRVLNEIEDHLTAIDRVLIPVTDLIYDACHVRSLVVNFEKNGTKMPKFNVAPLKQLCKRLECASLGACTNERMEKFILGMSCMLSMKVLEEIIQKDTENNTAWLDNRSLEQFDNAKKHLLTSKEREQKSSTNTQDIFMLILRALSNIEFMWRGVNGGFRKLGGSREGLGLMKEFNQTFQNLLKMSTEAVNNSWACIVMSNLKIHPESRFIVNRTINLVSPWHIIVKGIVAGLNTRGGRGFSEDLQEVIMSFLMPRKMKLSEIREVVVPPPRRTSLRALMTTKSLFTLRNLKWCHSQDQDTMVDFYIFENLTIRREELGREIDPT